MFKKLVKYVPWVLLVVLLVAVFLPQVIFRVHCHALKNIVQERVNEQLLSGKTFIKADNSFLVFADDSTGEYYSIFIHGFVDLKDKKISVVCEPGRHGRMFINKISEESSLVPSTLFVRYGTSFKFFDIRIGLTKTYEIKV